MDLSAYLLAGVNNVPDSSTANVVSGMIKELDSNKNVVFEWHASDHFLFDEVVTNVWNNPNTVD